MFYILFILMSIGIEYASECVSEEVSKWMVDLLSERELHKYIRVYPCR